MEGKEQLLASLHKREREILAQLSAGLSDQQIADQLVLSLHTIKWYNARFTASWASAGGCRPLPRQEHSTLRRERSPYSSGPSGKRSTTARGA